MCFLKLLNLNFKNNLLCEGRARLYLLELPRPLELLCGGVAFVGTSILTPFLTFKTRGVMHIQWDAQILNVWFD